MTEVFKNDKSFFLFDSSKLRELMKSADNSQKKLSRFLLHTSHDKKVQEMIIMMKKGCSIQPNRVLQKSESLTVIYGKVLLVIFNEEGEIQKEIELSLSSESDDFISSYRIESSFWHTMLPITEYACVHEILEGPFENTKDDPIWLIKKEKDLKKLFNKYI